MIVKMKFLSISGPRTDIDRVSASYLSKYEMQLENAITELKTTDNLMPFMDVNPYKEPLSKAEQYVLMLAQPKGEMDTSLTADEILTMIRDLNHDYLDLKAREDRLKKQKEELLEKLHELEPFQPLELNLKEVYGYQYMKVRFGRVNVEYYQKLEKYLFDDLNAIFLEGIRNENYVYGCYFAAHKEMGKIDSTFKSLHFENIALPDDYEGMPAEICRNLRNQIDEIEKEIENVFDFESIKNEIKEFILEKVGVHTVLNHGINQTDSQSVSVYSGKNELVCYITGLSSVTAALVQVCAVYGVELTLMHYDRDTDEYVPQVIFSKNRWRI